MNENYQSNNNNMNAKKMINKLTLEVWLQAGHLGHLGPDKWLFYMKLASPDSRVGLLYRACSAHAHPGYSFPNCCCVYKRYPVPGSEIIGSPGIEKARIAYLSLSRLPTI